MDLQLVTKKLGDFSKRRKWIIALALLGVGSYGAYKVYHLPSVERKRKRLFKLLGAIISMAELVSDSSETIGIVTKDLKVFLQSDSDQIPRSLRQLSKIARSEEFSESVVKVTRAMTIGVMGGYKVDAREEIEEKGTKLDFGDKVMDKLMSTAGTGFVSVIVGSFARNLVVGFYSNEGLNGEKLASTSNAESSSSSSPNWLNIVSSKDCRLLVADCIQTFVSTAVAVYLDKTMDVNFYDDLFSGLTNPKHQTNVTDFLVSICNGAVETLVKTSHQVLTTPKTDSNSSSFSTVDHSENTKFLVPLQKMKEKRESKEVQNSGWVSTVSSTLAVPNNRRFVLDLTGRVTYETIRSLVEYFFRWFSEGLKKTMTVLNEEVIERGLEVIRYVGAKSSVIVTICLAMYLHILGGSRAFLPA